MLNKIKIIGRAYPIEQKNFEENKEPVTYFSLSVPSPSGVITTLRCGAWGEIAERIKNEIQKDDIVEVSGYLRNEKSGLQILVRVLKFTKLGINFEEIDNKIANQVRLLGKIVTDFRLRSDSDKNKEIISFKITVPREGIKSPLFFCRAHGELILEVTNQLKKGDIVLWEGFLQTGKIIEIQENNEERRRYISAVICQGFTYLDNDFVDTFSYLSELKHITRTIKEIDFTKPRE